MPKKYCLIQWGINRFTGKFNFVFLTILQFLKIVVLIVLVIVNYYFSLRTLCRALSIASVNLCGNIQRSLYEALCLSFLTQLNSESHKIVKNTIAK